MSEASKEAIYLREYFPSWVSSMPSKIDPKKDTGFSLYHIALSVDNTAMRAMSRTTLSTMVETSTLSVATSLCVSALRTWRLGFLLLHYAHENIRL